MTCRQAPHGAHGMPWSCVTATERIWVRGPNCATAENIAVLSAQLVIPYEAFSTLQPKKISPLVVRIAAPTRNFEYGAWAFFMTFRADVNNCSRTSVGIIRLRMRN